MVITALKTNVKLQLAAHCLIFAHHMCCSLYTNLAVDFKSRKEVAVLDLDSYRFRYLTTWNFIMQCFYLGMVIVYDLLKLMPQSKKSILWQKSIHKFRGYVYTTLIFPSTMLVFGMFWIVWNINRELVFPKVIDAVLPLWVNHSIHTNILFLLVVEAFIYKRTPTFKNAAIGSFIFTLSYSLTFFFTYYQTSRWLYNLFGLFSWPQRILFMFGSYLTSLVFIKICIFLETLVNNGKLPNTGHHKILSKKLM